MDFSTQIQRQSTSGKSWFILWYWHGMASTALCWKGWLLQMRLFAADEVIHELFYDV